MFSKFECLAAQWPKSLSLSLSPLQTPCSPSPSRWLCVQPQLAAPDLLPVCSNLRRPADSGRCGSLPAFLQQTQSTQSGSTQPQSDWSNSSQRLLPALITDGPGGGVFAKNQMLRKCFYIVFTLIKLLIELEHFKDKHYLFFKVSLVAIFLFLHSTFPWQTNRARSSLCLFNYGGLLALYDEFNASGPCCFRTVNML